MPKQFATPAMEGTRKRRPRERWRDQVQEDLDIVGITNRQTIARDRWERGDDYVGSHGPQRTVSVEKEEKAEEVEEEENKYMLVAPIS
jgi:hypothetical protein